MQVFGEYKIWFVVENGMYLCYISKEWIFIMEYLNMDWKESVQVEVIVDMQIYLSRDLVVIDFYVVIIWIMCCSFLLLSME